MDIILWILFGGLVGWIASIIMGKDAQMGIGANIIVGIIGSLIGGWLFTFFGSQGITGFNLWSFIVGIVGAVLLIWIVGELSRPVSRI